MKYLVCIALLCASLVAQAQNSFQDRAQRHFYNEENAQMVQVLQAWEQAEPINPERFIQTCVLYLRLANRVGKAQWRQANPALAAQEDSTYAFGNPAFRYNDSLFMVAQQYLDQGLTQYPKRLDMWITKMLSYKEKEDWKAHLNTNLALISTYKQDSTGWYMSTNNDLAEEATVQVQMAIQGAANDLLESGQYAANDILAIGQGMSSAFPGTTQGHTLIASAYFEQNNYAQAYQWYNKALQITPNNGQILLSVGVTAFYLGQRQEAIAHFEKVLQVGSAPEKQQAQANIDAIMGQ